MPAFILRTATVTVLRSVQPGTRIGGKAEVAVKALNAGIDASDDGSLVEYRLDCAEIDAVLHLVGLAVSDWENGDLDGEDGVYEALEAARETLNEALDEAHEGELDGLAAIRDHDRAYGDDTPTHGSRVVNDAGEILGIH
ncbi:MAG: hypothetical protein ABN488_02995 [Methylobacteriaceae bacterium]